MEMHSYSRIIWLLFIFIASRSIIVNGEPEPMARPTRPKVFTSPEELRRYLDHVRDYYSLNGKARYGKRGEDIPTKVDAGHSWDALRTIFDARRQMQEEQQEENIDNGGRQEREDWFHDFRISKPSKQYVRFSSRPTAYLLGVFEKYYDDVQ